MTELIPREIVARAEAACCLAVVQWGAEPQYRQAQEECAELIAAINRMERGRPLSREQAEEEAADVILCLLQLRLMLGPGVDERLKEKLERLEKRLNK